nr:hypothetical protein [Porphyromonas sp. COT-052 OH4946]
MARDFFRSGSASENFTRRNEKNLVPLFSILRMVIGEVPVRKFSTDSLPRWHKIIIISPSFDPI